MNPAPSPSRSNLTPSKGFFGRLALLVVYTGAVCGLRTLCFKAHLYELIVVPLLAELLLGWALEPHASFWKGALFRLAGLALGNTLAVHWIIWPATYHEQTPWPEELLWLYVMIGIQTAIAWLALGLRRALRRRVR